MRSAAVIGLGNISKRHRQNLKLLFPQIRVTALSASGNLAGRDVCNADHIAGSLSELIEQQPDFAIVASPATSHAEHTIELLHAGIPVLTEKPLTATPEDAERIIQAQSASGTTAAVAYCFRFHPLLHTVQSLISEQQLGTLYNIWINLGQFLPQWRPVSDYRQTVTANASLGGGVLLELSHELDYLRWIFGPLNCVYASLRDSGELEMDAEQIADLMLTTEQGTLCNVHLDLLQKAPRRSLSILGSAGRLEADLLSNRIWLHRQDSTELIHSGDTFSANQMYLDMLSAFTRQLSGTVKTELCSLTEAAETVRLIDRIKGSSHHQQ